MTGRIGPKRAAVVLAVMLQGAPAVAMAQDVITLFDHNVHHDNIYPRIAAVYFNLETDGDISETFGTGRPMDIGDWITPKVNMAAYQCRATLISGDTPFGGPLNTWLPLTSNCSWSLAQTTPGQQSSIFLLEIRRASDGAVLASARIWLNAYVEVF